MFRSEAYREGYQAYLDGKSRNDNPYNYDPSDDLIWEKYESWKDGFDDAGWDD